MPDYSDVRKAGRPKKGAGYKPGDGIGMTVDFTPKVADDLNWLKDEVEAPSYIEVLRLCIRRTRKLVHAEKHEKVKIFLEYPDGRREEIYLGY